MSANKSHELRPVQAERPEETDAPRAQSGDQSGWDAYRKWLSRVSTKPVGERSPRDHSIYSWRGYHTWADKVREGWKSES